MLDRFARLALACLAVLALAAFAAGCGDDDDEGEAGEAKAVNIEAGPAQKGESKLTAPKSVEAGLVEITFKNSDKADHEAGLIRLEGDHTAEDAIKAIQQSEEEGIPGWIQDGGGVGTTKGGATRTSTEVLAPGKWIVYDTEPDKPVTAEFEVTGEEKDAELPEADGTVIARDYSFAPSGLKAGKNSVLFDNQGNELHHLIALPMKSGATIEEVRKFLETEKGEPPLEREGEDGTSVIDGGRKQVVDLNLRSGKYALVCFINDRKGGPPHTAKGMLNELTVR
jgi:hypothetical protein